MPRTATPHPTYATYEDFLVGMEKESDETKRYFFKQIQFAEKERIRKSGKDKRRYQKKKNAEAEEAEKVEEPPSKPIPTPVQVHPKPEPPTKKLPEYVEPRNLPIIQSTKRQS